MKKKPSGKLMVLQITLLRDCSASGTKIRQVQFLYFVYDGNEDASSSVSDVHHYIIIRKLLDFIYNILPVLIRLWECQT
jgi:hypothetical protein